MAIKISGTTVVDDSRNACNICSLTACGTVTLNGVVYPTGDGTAGQVLKTNGSGTLSFAADGGQVTVCEMTSSGTFTMPATACYIEVEVWGGGNGGCCGNILQPPPPFLPPTSLLGCGGNGGIGGGYSIAKYLACCIPPTVCVIVGAGGVGSTPTISGAGGVSCFGSLICVGLANRVLPTLDTSGRSASGDVSPTGTVRTRLGVGFNYGERLVLSGGPELTQLTTGSSGYGGGGGGVNNGVNVRGEGGVSLYGGGGGGAGTSYVAAPVPTGFALCCLSGTPGGSSFYGSPGASGGQGNGVGCNATGNRGGGGGGGAAAPAACPRAGGCGGPGSVRITIW